MQTSGFRYAAPALVVVIAALLVAGAFVEARGLQASVAMAMLAAFVLAGWWLAPRICQEGEIVLRSSAAATISLGLWTLLPNLLGHFGVLRTEVFLPAVAVVLFAAFAARRGDDIPSKAARLDGEGVLLGATASMFALFVIRKMWDGRLLPLGWFGGDDLSYHATAVAVWNRSHDLRMVKFSFGDPVTPFYPIGSELVAWTLLAPFPDSDFLARWSQLPFFLASMVAVMAIVRRLGGTTRDGAVAALLYAATPRLFPALALSTGNDCSTAFYTLAAVDAILALRGTARSALHSGLALGLLAGTKYVGLIFAAPLLLFALIRSVQRPRAVRTLLVTASTIAAVAFVTGGYTYARNAAVTGNPLFPARVAIGGRVLLDGWDEATVGARMQKPEAAIEAIPFLTKQNRALGRLFPRLLLPAALLAPLVWLARRRDRRGIALLFPVVFFLQFLYLIPDHRDIRYLLPAVAMAAVCAVWLFGQLPARAVVVLRVLTLALLCHWFLLVTARSWLGRSAFLAASLVIAFGAAFLAPRIRTVAVAALAAILAVSPALATTIVEYQTGRFSRQHEDLDEFPAAAWLDRATRSSGTIVAFAGGNHAYPFFGSRQQNEVAIVPTRGPVAARYFDWNGGVSRPYRQGHYGQWERNLRVLGTEYLVLQRSGGEEPERSWAVGHPEVFTRVYADATVEIWRISAGRAGSEE